MTSRLNQSNTRLALSSQRWGIPEIVGGVCVLAAVYVRGAATLGYRVPSSPMPRTTLQQPHHRQPATSDQAVFGERLDGVLAAGRTEPARRQAHRRHGMAGQPGAGENAPGNG